MGTRTGGFAGGLAERAARKAGIRNAGPAALAGMLCVVAMTACSNAVPSVPPTVAGSPGASRTPIASKPAASGTAFGTFNACALLPAAALSKVVGTPRIAPMPSAGWMAGQCAWSSPKSGFFLSVGTASSIQKASDPAAPDAKAKLDEFRQRVSSIAKPKEIAGIGDGAVLGGTGMAAYKGGTYLEVTKLQLTDDQLIKILKLAVSRL